MMLGAVVLGVTRDAVGDTSTASADGLLAAVAGRFDDAGQLAAILRSDGAVG